MEVEIEKSTVTKYKLYASGEDRNWLWAHIIVDEASLSLDIQSDYGDYCHRWHSVGLSFKQFLTETDNSYLYSKFGGESRERFSCEKTCKAIKKEILDCRRARGDWKYTDSITKDQARECWDQIHAVQREGLDSGDAAFRDIWTGALNEYMYPDPHGIPYVKDDCAQTTMFLERIWPHFVKELKGEL